MEDTRKTLWVLGFGKFDNMIELFENTVGQYRRLSDF